MSDTTSVDADERAQKSVEPASQTAIASVQARSKRLPKLVLLAIVAAVAVAVAVVAFALLQARPAATPEYSLTQMTKAFRSGSWSRVQKYMDVDAVAASFADATLANAMDGDSPDTLTGDAGGMGGGGNAPGSSSEGLAGTMKDAFVGRFRESLKQTVEARGNTSTGEPSTLLLLESPTKMEYVSETEVLATVQVPTDDGGTEDIVVRMISVGDRWRIIALEDFADLMSSVS